MTLTPEEINKIRGASGLKPLQSTASTSTSLVDDFNASLGNSNIDGASYGEKVGQEQLVGGKKISSSISKGAEDIQKGVDQQASNSFGTKIKGFGNVVKGGAEAAFGTITGATEAVFAPVTPAIKNIIQKATTENPNFADSPAGKLTSYLAPKLDAFAQAHPDAATLTGDILNTALIAIGGNPLEAVGKDAVKTAFTKEALSGAIKDVAGAVKDIPGVVSDVAGSVINTADKIKTGVSDLVTESRSKASELIKGKSLDEVLTTPQDKLHTLSPEQRKVYFDNAKEQVNQAQKTIESKINTNLDTKVSTIQSEAEALKRELDVSSRDEVVALRPKIVKAMGEQSRIYRNLVEEELAPIKDTAVGNKEFGRYIDSISGDPQLAQSTKDMFGIVDKAVHDPQTTVGKLYDQLQTAKQDLKAANKGTRVFTPQEKAIDDSINILNGFLKTKGLDLTKANQFWAKYAPVRNQLVAEAKPFLQTPVQTKTFANTITRVLKGTDVNNENFVSEVENLLNTKIGTKSKDILSKLDKNTKSELAAKIEAETTKIDAKIKAEKALKSLDDAAFNAERNARIRKGILFVLKTVGVVEAAKLLGVGLGQGI